MNILSPIRTNYIVYQNPYALILTAEYGSTVNKKWQKPQPSAFYYHRNITNKI